jgi:hypothetical protein
MNAAALAGIGQRLELQRALQDDLLAGFQSDEPVLPQAGKRPAHRLDGEAEVVGHVLSRHRQADHEAAIGGVVAPGCEPHEKRRHLLLGGLAAQEQHLDVGALEIGLRKLEQAHRELRV